MRFGAVIALFFLACPSWGALIGTTVTGSLTFSSGNPNNFFNPANGFVPARFENAAGTHVTISDSAVEFGFNDGANRDIANFIDGQLIIRDRARGGAGSVAYTLTFTDPVFAGLSLVSSTFTKPLDYSIVGDEIEITVPKFSRNGRYRAVFALTSTPEPGSFGMLGLSVGLLALGGAKWRSRRLIKLVVHHGH